MVEKEGCSYNGAAAEEWRWTPVMGSATCILTMLPRLLPLKHLSPHHPISFSFNYLPTIMINYLNYLIIINSLFFCFFLNKKNVLIT